MKLNKYCRNLDLYDKKIIYRLDINARTSASEIARKIRLPKETVNFRIKRLIRNGYIKYFYTILNASRLGYQYYKIFFKFSKITENVEKDIIEYILNEKSCANLRATEGFYDMCFVTMQKNPNELKKFLHRFNKNFGKYLFQKSMHTILSSYKLNQKFIFLGKAIKLQIYHGKVDNYSLNKIDLKIIKLLSIQARIRLIDIAHSIKEDPKVIRYHIKRLEQIGIIAGYFTTLNMDLFHRIFVQIDISLKDPDYINSIIEFFDQTGTCVFASELLGKYDLTVELYVENDHQLRTVLVRFKEKFLQKYISYDISRIYREFVINWSPFDAYGSLRESNAKFDQK